MSQNTTPDKAIYYIGSFDTLRGFAIVAVLLFHRGYNIYFKGGWIGVDLFFVVSGYLITSILCNEYSTTNNISISSFYYRRFKRLFLPLLLCVLLSNVLWPLTSHKVGDGKLLSSISSLLYFSNFIDPKLTGNLSHTWSLSVEEHFYLFWPLLLLLVLKVKTKTAVTLLVMFIVCLSAFRIFISIENPNWYFGYLKVDQYRFTLCRIDTILCGALLAIIQQQNNLKMIGQRIPLSAKTSILSIFCFFIILIWMLQISPIWYSGGFIITNLLCMSVVYLAVKYQHSVFFSSKIFSWIGKRSYGIYIYHYPIFLFIDQFRIPYNPISAIFITAVCLIVSFIAAYFSYKYIEQPVSQYKTQLFKPENFQFPSWLIFKKSVRVRDKI